MKQCRVCAGFLVLLAVAFVWLEGWLIYTGVVILAENMRWMPK